MVSIGYVRISNEKKQDPASQIKLMVDQGIDMKNIFVDMESGATIPRTRESFIKMEERLKQGDVTELVFSEYSRMGRDIVESLGAILDIMRSYKDVKLRSLSKTESAINDYPIDMQFTMLMFSMGTAQREREHIRERTKWGMNNAKVNGTKTGNPIGRPVVEINFEAIQNFSKEKKLRTAQVLRVFGIAPSTYYAALKQKREGGVYNANRA